MRAKMITTVLLLSILGSVLLGLDYIASFIEMEEWLKLVLTTLNLTVLVFCVFKLPARKLTEEKNKDD